MSQQLVHSQTARRISEMGTQRSIRESQLSNAVTLREGEEVAIYSNQTPADKVYGWGSGSNQRNSGRTAFMYADLRATGNGSGTADETITGDLVAVVTDSEQRDVHARYELGDLQNLADAQAENRVDRPLQPLVVPLAREDQHLELRIIADANADGYELDNGSSQSTTARVYYTDINDNRI